MRTFWPGTSSAPSGSCETASQVGWQVDQFARATLAIARREVNEVDREAFLALPEFEIGHFPAGMLAEQPAIVRVPVILRELLGLFHQLFQQHIPPCLAPVFTSSLTGSQSQNPRRSLATP